MATKKTNERRRIKSVAVVVSIFIIIIVIGFIREYYAQTSAMKPTENQILAAKTIVASMLQERGDNVSNYQFSAATTMRRLVWNGSAQNVLLVTLTNASIKHAYLIDVDSGTVLMHAEIDAVGGDGTDLCEELNVCRFWRAESER